MKRLVGPIGGLTLLCVVMLSLGGGASAQPQHLNAVLRGEFAFMLHRQCAMPPFPSSSRDLQSSFGRLSYNGDGTGTISSINTTIFVDVPTNVTQSSVMCALTYNLNPDRSGSQLLSDCVVPGVVPVPVVVVGLEHQLQLSMDGKTLLIGTAEADPPGSPPTETVGGVQRKCGRTGVAVRISGH